eukprot:Pgem_evm1s7026
MWSTEEFTNCYYESSPAIFTPTKQGKQLIVIEKSKSEQKKKQRRTTQPLYSAKFNRSVPDLPSNENNENNTKNITHKSKT